jgi:hypothetical protein
LIFDPWHRHILFKHIFEPDCLNLAAGIVFNGQELRENLAVPDRSGAAIRPDAESQPGELLV